MPGGERPAGDAGEVVVQVLEWAGSGIVGTYAVHVSSRLYHAVSGDDDGKPMARHDAHDLARSAINGVYRNVIDADALPIREALGPERWMVTFRVDDRHYWAKWTRSLADRPPKPEVGFDSVP